ncbi:cytochrome c oxidase assembly protein [Brevundimonas sp.]|uniref:cytochrome c oxidase assembly protein n=1 Tax=Brevundimonas sp. TaxID=1871086 RepID=UPI0025B9B5E9|nr:cytochrome c oxidase assembly protein [Brevundimonas sp.]
MRWNFDPALLIGLAAISAGLVWMTRQDPRSRSLALAAVATLIVGFVSPLCALSSALFTARTLHHVLLVAIAAPLLACALPRLHRWHGGARLIGVFGFAVLFWAWHTPAAYAFALSNDAAYWVMQLSLLGTATVFWMSVRVSPGPAAVIALLITMVQTGLLGALLVFMPAAIYAPHLLTTTAWGLSPLEDQQLAGLIMWAPAAAVYLVAALTILGRWIGPDRLRKQSA